MTRRSLFALLVAAVALPWVPKLPFRGKMVVPDGVRGQWYKYHWVYFQPIPRYNAPEFWLLYLEDSKGDLWVPPTNALPKADLMRNTPPDTNSWIYIRAADMPESNRVFKSTPSSDGRALV